MKKKNYYIERKKITIMTAGTTGDVLPYVTLGLKLREYGHDVSIATGENFEQLVTERGIPFLPIRVDLNKLMESEERRRS